MRRVGDAVGITAMAIYRHFPDRAALLNALADQGFADLAGQLAGRRATGSFDSQLYATADIYVQHALARPRLHELMFLKPRKGARRFPRDFKAGRSPTANLAVQAFQQGIERGVLRRDDPWELTFGLGALLDGAVMLYLGGRVDASAVQFRALVKRCVRRYLDGIRK